MLDLDKRIETYDPAYFRELPKVSSPNPVVMGIGILPYAFVGEARNANIQSAENIKKKSYQIALRGLSNHTI